MKDSSALRPASGTLRLPPEEEGSEDRPPTVFPNPPILRLKDEELTQKRKQEKKVKMERTMSVCRKWKLEPTKRRLGMSSKNQPGQPKIA